MRLNCLAIFFCFLTSVLYAQISGYDLVLEGAGQLYSGERSPFWMHTQNLGRLDEKSHFYTLLNSSAKVEVNSDEYFQLDVDLIFKDGFENEFRFDQIFFEYVSPKIGFFVGKKHRLDLYQGLSASGESILRSLNAPAFPGIGIYSTEPIFISSNHGLGIMGSLEEYLLDDERYIEDTRIHHKSFHLVYKNKSNFRVDLGIQHYVQWAGTSEEFGILPKSLDDYIRVFTGMAGDKDIGGQEVNALGNQIGSYEIKISSKLKGLDFQFIYNHIFEDASGMKMGNFPDGRYAMYFEDNRDTFWGTPWLKALMYEIYYTKNQSRDRLSSAEDGPDNYFNNNLYRSGWTYKNRVIGTPFILLTDERFRIGTNILLVHHLGLKGKVFDKTPYKFLISYRKGYGAKFYSEKKESLSTLLEMDLIDSEYNLKAQFGADINSHQDSNFGFGINFSKTIF